MLSFKTNQKKISIDKLLKDNGLGNTVDKTLKKINSLLDRKDVQKIDNEKVDALRMLVYYLEDNDGLIDSKRFVKFLKS